MSSCELFQLLTKASNLGEKLAIVKLHRGNEYVIDVVVGGKPLLGRIPNNIMPIVDEALSSGATIRREVGDTVVTVEPMEARPTIIIVGSGLVAKAITRLGADLGYYIAVVGNGDVKKADFPSAAFVSNDLSDLESMVTEGSIVIVANEGGKPYDVDAVYIALTRGARFVGLLASQRRGAYTIAELIKRNVPIDLIRKKLHTPVGIDVGGKTAEEVALSILAQVVMTIRRGSGKLMEEAKDPYELLNEALEGKISPHCSWTPATMI